MFSLLTSLTLKFRILTWSWSRSSNSRATIQQSLSNHLRGKWSIYLRFSSAQTPNSSSPWKWAISFRMLSSKWVVTRACNNRWTITKALSGRRSIPRGRTELTPIKFTSSSSRGWCKVWRRSGTQMGWWSAGRTRRYRRLRLLRRRLSFSNSK